MSEVAETQVDEEGAELSPDEPDTEAPGEDSEGEEDAEDAPGVDENGDAGEGDEGEPEASAPEGPTPEQIDKALERIERRAATYREKVAEIAAQVEQPLTLCPVCLPMVPGFIFDPTVIPLGEVQEAGAKILLGQGIGPDYRQAPTAQTCPTCNGWGKVRTGSRVDGKALLTCPECRGLGFIGEAANLTPAQVAGREDVPLALAPDPDTSLPDEDQWGTPRSHPDFGVMPQYRSPGWADELEAFKRTLSGEVATR